MNTAIWIIQGLLAAFFIMPAIMKLISSKEELVEKKNIEPEQSVNGIRFIGLMELLGSIGIIIPQLTGILKILTPMAAVGFALIMSGAFFVHLKKREFKILPLLVLVFALSVLVAYYRFTT